MDALLAFGALVAFVIVHELACDFVEWYLKHTASPERYERYKRWNRKRGF